MARKIISFEVIFLGLVLAAHLFFVLAPVNWILDRWFTTDDAFYYYQVARNILAGHGSTFDGINLSNGYHPLWMLVMLPVFSLAKINLILPLRVIIFLSALLTAGTGIWIYRILKLVVRPSLAMLAAFFWAFYLPLHNIVTKQGMETAVNTFAVSLLILQTARLLSRPPETESARDRFTLGALAALALFSRLDNAFLVLVVGLVLLFRTGRRYVYWTGMILVGLLSVFLAFLLRFDFQREYSAFLPAVYAMLAVSLPLKLLVGYFAGLLSRPPVWRWRGELPRILMTVFLSSLPAGAALLLLARLGILASVPRLALIYEPLVSLVLLFLLRVLCHWLAQPPAQMLSPLMELKASWKSWLTRGIQYAAPVVLTFGAYLAFNTATFGTPMPVSGQVKHWWGLIFETVYGKPITDLPSLVGLFPRLDKSPWNLLFEPAIKAVKEIASATGGGNDFLARWMLPAGLVWLAVLAGGLALRRKRLLDDFGATLVLALLASSLLQILTYTGSFYVNYKPWYWSNEMLLAVILVVLFLDGLLRLVEKIPSSGRWVDIVLGLAAVWLLAAFLINQVSSVNTYRTNQLQAAYLQEVAFVEQMTPPGSLIGMPGGGATAYFITGRTITNLDGLINSKEYYETLKAWEVPAYLKKIGLDYVMGSDGVIFLSAPYYSIFPDHTEFVGKVLGFKLYKYIAP